mmetsp:Transcript_6973/g.11634  ORF Transcript_6973/g.11634 Transcript_6973/m.11634 type:complete len:796 (-) Transcript_6973:352-2739(-)
MSNAVTPVPKDGKTKTKSGTVAERVVWMSRTSDIHGSHLKTDLDSYLALIRRKIQEKCSTTMELITQIRRNKIGESGHVTPNEFRFTLIKFGIILPQPLVDRIFNVFDSDRSGTMDFDEFAMWIMNSEFRPAGKGGGAAMDTPRTIMRRKLQNVVQANRKTFTNMREQISFLQFVADITRLSLPLTDREARSIFQVLDPKDTGYIDSSALLTWADTGVIITKHKEHEPPELKVNNLKELVNKVVGRTTKQFEASFAHIPHDEGVKISFDEFRRCLLNAGVGKNVYDVRQLFMALGGKTEGMADIDLLFNNVAPMINDPATAVSDKPGPTKSISTSRADRQLRDRMRKCYKQVKVDLEAADTNSTGFIDAERLFKILVKRCMPLTFQDFRFIVQQIKKEPGTTRLDYHHFLHGYNPMNAPHALEGPATIRSYDSPPKPLSGSLSMHSLNPSRSANNNNTGDNTAASLAAKEKYLAATMPASRGEEEVKDGGRSASNSASSTGAGMGKSKSLGNLTVGAGYTAAYNNKSTELKRIWQGVLRECHRADPERCGQVSRTAFIAALQKCNLDKSMTAEAMSKLTDEYTLSNGLVNYLHLFRTYLNDITGTGKTNQSKFKLLNASGGGAGANEGELSKSGELKPIHPVHPWEYTYERHKHSHNPYWAHANSMPKDAASLNPAPAVTVPPPSEKGANDLSSTEKEALLAKYNPKMLDLCARCYQILAPRWRVLRNEFKKSQIASQRGSVLTVKFLEILENNGIMLSKSDLANIVRCFRGVGMQDVVRYDEYLRVCMLVKDRQ